MFDGWVADCPLTFCSPNAASKRDLLGTVLLSVLSGHNRYAHITMLRCDAVNLRLLGISGERGRGTPWPGEDRRSGRTGWLQTHLDYCSSPLLSEPWVLDIDSTIKPLYGHQEGAMVGYNPHKPGRPSHCYHTYMMANLRLVLGVDVQPGDGHGTAEARPGRPVVDDWALAQALADTLSPDQLHRTLDRVCRLYCPVYATDLVFRSTITLGPLYEQLVRQSVLNVKAEQVATFLGRSITPLLAQEIGSQFSTRIEGTCIKHRFGKCSIKMYDPEIRQLALNCGWICCRLQPVRAAHAGARRSGGCSWRPFR